MLILLTLKKRGDEITTLGYSKQAITRHLKWHLYKNKKDTQTLCTHGCNQDLILETIEAHSHFGNLVKTHVDEDDTLKQGIVDNLGRKLVS